MAEPATASGLSTPDSLNLEPRGLKRRKPADDTPPASPQLRRIRIKQDVDEDSAHRADALEEALRQQNEVILRNLQVAKELRSGSDRWTPEENLLFDTIFLREYIPMLPRQWEPDFGDIHLGYPTFQTSSERPPVIYSRSGKDFQGSMAFLRLVDLTNKTFTVLQTRTQRAGTRLIKRELDHFFNWAARDGEYSSLRVVPNIAIEAVSNELGEARITEYIEGRMKALARLQREFYKVDEDPGFWDISEQEAADGQTSMEVMLLDKFSTPRGKRTPMDDTISLSESTPGDRAKDVADEKRCIVVEAESDMARESSPKTPATEPDDTAETQEIAQEKEASIARAKVDEMPETPPRVARPVDVEYRRQPPVVYGLFIINAKALVLSVDAAKGEEGYVSFYGEADFETIGQGMWNALTIGTVVCKARDELMTRLGDFEREGLAETSDPDA